MIIILMNKERVNRFSKLSYDGDPWVPNNLLKPGPTLNLEIVSAINFRKCFSKFMIPIALLEKFGC